MPEHLGEMGVCIMLIRSIRSMRELSRNKMQPTVYLHRGTGTQYNGYGPRRPVPPSKLEWAQPGALWT